MHAIPDNVFAIIHYFSITSCLPRTYYKYIIIIQCFRRKFGLLKYVDIWKQYNEWKMQSILLRVHRESGTRTKNPNTAQHRTLRRSPVWGLPIAIGHVIRYRSCQSRERKWLACPIDNIHNNDFRTFCTNRAKLEQNRRSRSATLLCVNLAGSNYFRNIQILINIATKVCVQYLDQIIIIINGLKEIFWIPMPTACFGYRRCYVRQISNSWDIDQEATTEWIFTRLWQLFKTLCDFCNHLRYSATTHFFGASINDLHDIFIKQVLRNVQCT